MKITINQLTCPADIRDAFTKEDITKRFRGLEKWVEKRRKQPAAHPMVILREFGEEVARRLGAPLSSRVDVNHEGTIGPQADPGPRVTIMSFAGAYGVCQSYEIRIED